MNSTTVQSEMTNSPKRAIRRFGQFGISFILLVTLCVAILLGWMANNQRLSQLEQQVLDTYAPTTVRYDYEPEALKTSPIFGTQTAQAPGWGIAKRLYGDHVFARVASLTIMFGEMTDVDLLVNLRELRTLKIWECDNLRCLNGISDLPKLDSFKILDCDGLLDINLFASLPNVRTLELSCSFMQPEFFDRLAELDRLESLTLQLRDGVGDTEGYSSLVQIRELVLSAPFLRDLEGLKKMKHLKVLGIEGALTMEQFEELREALPNTRIHARGGISLPRPFAHPIDAPRRKQFEALDFENHSVSQMQSDQATFEESNP